MIAVFKEALDSPTATPSERNVIKRLIEGAEKQAQFLESYDQLLLEKKVTSRM
jgi:hypothetical protein